MPSWPPRVEVTSPDCWPCSTPTRWSCADAAAVRMGSDALVSGAQSVAETFAGRARAARPALIDGGAGAAWLQGGETKVAFAFTVVDGRITEIELLADPDVVGAARVELV